MTEVTQGVYFIQGQDEMIPDSHVYLIGKLSSEDLTLVDAGLVGKGAYKLQTLKEGGVKLASIKRVIMTHTHLDHIGCLSEIMKELPSAELWIHALEAEPIELGDDRGVYGIFRCSNRCARPNTGSKDGAFKFKVDRKLQGGEALDIGGMSWEVLHIPGHSMGGIALYHKEQGVLIPGDVIYVDYAIGRFDLHGANPSQLKDSMKLAAVEVNVLLPGHNRIVKDVTKVTYFRQQSSGPPTLSDEHTARHPGWNRSGFESAYRVTQPHEVGLYPADFLQISVFRRWPNAMETMLSTVEACRSAHIRYVIHPVEYTLSELRPERQKNSDG